MKDFSKNGHSKDVQHDVEVVARKTMKQRMMAKISVLPAMFTLLNAISGFGSIYFTVKIGGFEGGVNNPEILTNLQYAAGLMFVAMFCDMLDGRVARMTRTTSDFGAQLDSMCDVISFGVAPAILALRASVGLLRENIQYLPVERIIWAVAAIYVCCAVLRLARFNVETEQDESSHMDFKGLPTPAAAACIATMVLLLSDLMKNNPWDWLCVDQLAWTMSITLPILMLVTAMLMVSGFKYPHVVNHYIRGKKPFTYLVKFVVICLVAIVQPYLTFAVITLIFTISGPIKAIFTRNKDSETSGSLTSKN